MCCAACFALRARCCSTGPFGTNSTVKINKPLTIKPGIRLGGGNQQLLGPSGLTIGLDLVEIINMFRVKRNRNLQFLQTRLLKQEQEKYVQYRFTKRFVIKLTRLEGEELDRFMNYCRPSYEVLGLLNDLELGYYIEKKYQAFKGLN